MSSETRPAAALPPSASELPDYAALRPADIEPALRALVARLRDALQQVCGEGAPAPERTDWDNLVEPLQAAGEALSRAWSMVSHLHAVVVGRSNIVGKPMALMLLEMNATVTIAHSGTPDLAQTCRRADVLVAAVGRPRMIGGDMIKPGAAVIDVGINRLPDGKLCGDVDFAAASEVAGWITPVPGGVGPMTIAMLLANTLQACEQS